MTTEAFATSAFVPESPSNWISDSKRTNCANCRESFSLIKRRHHCRSCSEIYCDSCSSYRLKARSRREPNLIVRVRVCQKCFETFRGRRSTGKTIKRAPVMRNAAQPVGQEFRKVTSITSTSQIQPTTAQASLSKLAVADEEDDFYSDDDGDHPEETDDEDHAPPNTIKLDSDHLPCVHVDTVNPKQFFAIKEESEGEAIKSESGYAVEPRIVSEERAYSSVNLDGGKLEPIVVNEISSLPAKEPMRPSEPKTGQTPLLDLLNAKSPKDHELTRLSDLQKIKDSVSQSKPVETTAVNLDGPHLPPVEIEIRSQGESGIAPAISSKGEVFSINFDSSNMTTHPKELVASSSPSKPSLGNSFAPPALANTDPLDQPLLESDDSSSVVVGPGAFNHSIRSPDIIAESVSHQPTANHPDWDTSAAGLKSPDADDVVMSTRTSSPIGIAALPKSDVQNGPSKGNPAPSLSGSINRAREWAESQSTDSYSAAIQSGQPVPPAVWPSAEVLAEASTHHVDAPSAVPAPNDQAWSPIGSSSSPIGLASMKTASTPASTLATSSSSEFDDKGMSKRKVKVRVMTGVRPLSLQEKILHPVPATILVVCSVVIAALLLPVTAIAVCVLAGLAAVSAYFWPALSPMIMPTVRRVTGNSEKLRHQHDPLHDDYRHLSNTSTSKVTASVQPSQPTVAPRKIVHTDVVTKSVSVGPVMSANVVSGSDSLSRPKRVV